MPSALPKKAHWPPAYIYLQAAGAMLFAFYLLHGFYADDAYISLRYAKNLLDGNGMTWNPGERIEGYTNFLFIVLTAALGRLGIDLVIASRIVGIASFVGLVALISIHTWHYSKSCASYAASVYMALTIGLVATSLPLISWALGGLEPDLFALLLLAAACLTMRMLEGAGNTRAAIAIGLLLALATMTRPDGALFFGYTLAFLGIYRLLPATRHRVPFLYLCIIALAFAALMTPYTLWRWSYYGSLLPNTYYAKASGIPLDFLWQQGIQYTGGFALTPPMLLLFAVGMTLAAMREGKIGPVIAYLGGLVMVFLLYVTSVGGDHMPYHRFLAPLVPLMALWIFHSALGLIESREKLLQTLSTFLIFFSLFQFVTVTDDTNATSLSRGAISGLAVQGYVAAHWPKGSLIAIDPAGALPYTNPDNRYIDMLGLLDTHIAHRTVTLKDIDWLQGRPIGHLKGDGAYVLTRNPDYIIFGDIWGDDKPRFMSDRELDLNPEFKRRYKRVEIYFSPPAELVPQLLKMQELNEQAKRKHIDFLTGPVLNDKNQLRFIYYQRRD